MSVEFIVDETPAGPPPPPERRRRGWWLAVALAAVVLLVWSLTRPAGDHQVAPSAGRHVVTRAARAARAAKPVPQCVGVPDCAVRERVPAPTERLLRAYLPATAKLRVKTVVAVNSLTLTDLLVERDIAVRHDSVTVLIRVQRGVDGSREIVSAPPGVGSLLLHHIAGGYVVRLQYLAPETVAPMLDQLRELTRDPRLESL